jgi:hypothetical protein
MFTSNSGILLVFLNNLSNLIISNTTQPKLHISIAFEYELPTNVSGALYNKVPNIMLRTFSVVLLLNCLACPKSPITKSEPFKNILLNILIIIYNSNK